MSSHISKWNKTSKLLTERSKCKHSVLTNLQAGIFAKLISISNQKKLNVGIKDGRPPPSILLLSWTRDLLRLVGIISTQITELWRWKSLFLSGIKDRRCKQVLTNWAYQMAQVLQKKAQMKFNLWGIISAKFSLLKFSLRSNCERTS